MIPRRFYWLFDAIILMIAFCIAYAIAPHVQRLFTPLGPLAFGWVQRNLAPPTGTVDFPPLGAFVWILLITIPGVILFLELCGAYNRTDRSGWLAVIASGAAPFFSLSVVALGLVAIKEISWSRLVFFLYGASASILMMLFRGTTILWRRHRRAAGSYAQNVVIIGSDVGLKSLAQYFTQTLSETEYRLFGYLVLSPTQPCLTSTDLPYLGSIEHLGQLAVHQPIHEVVVAIGMVQDDVMERISRDCDYFHIALRLVPEALLTQPLRDLQLSKSDDPFRLPSIVLRPRAVNSDVLFVKRLVDLVVSGAALILLSPLFLIVALAIKAMTPRAQIFYRWRVVGKNGVEFTGYKFTTMVADADEHKAKLAARNEMTGPVFKIRNDPRVTKLGRILRKFSINELPQLWSVFKGDMSLVGPRPAFRHELDRYELWHKRKLSVKPGLTCLWQVRGRNKISNFDEWVRMDFEYIDRWSLWLDAQILVRTVWVVVRGTGS
jgi:exopolysaccharide biosynthesis polyprenyl glycosylphosphotransferase